MTVSEYFLLKQQLMVSVSSNDRMILDEIKNYFKDKINSPRRCEQIKTVGQLLNILEIRDILSENNVNSLKFIAQFINDQELLIKIDRFESCQKTDNNYYGPGNVATVFPKINFQTFSNSNPYSHLNDRKTQRIYETVVEQIGTYWRDLARNLKIRECDIDNIDKHYISLQSKAERVLQMYREKADTQRWLLDLCESLEKARRKDLAKSINKILVMNI